MCVEAGFYKLLIWRDTEQLMWKETIIGQFIQKFTVFYWNFYLITAVTKAKFFTLSRSR